MSQKSERLLRIYSRLKQGPVTIELIKEWAASNNINISERTFYRDLDDLEIALMLTDEKLIVKTGEKNKKIWKIEFKLSNNDLDEFDINSYLLFKNFLSLPIVRSRKKSLDKIENLLYSTNSKSPFEDYLNIANQQIVGTHFYEVSNIDQYQKNLADAIWSIQNKREMEILEQLKGGLSYEQIATNLFISYGTVRKHIEHIYRKLQVSNKIEAVQKANSNRLFH